MPQNMVHYASQHAMRCIVVPGSRRLPGREEALAGVSRVRLGAGARGARPTMK